MTQIKKSDSSIIRKIFAEVLRLLQALFVRGVIPDNYRYQFGFLFRVYDPLKLRYIKSTLKKRYQHNSETLTGDGPIVLCLVRNSADLVEEFIEYYQKKGFSHIVLLDNISSDNTIALAKKYTNITVFETGVQFKDNNILLRRSLVELFGSNRWSLTVDIDEFWDYPYSDINKLSDFVQYLNGENYTAVVGQMLDLCMRKMPSHKHPLSDYAYYDISTVKKYELRSKYGFSDNECVNTKIQFFQGGCRADLFQITELWLTKMPFLFFDKNLRPLAHQHFSTGAKIADVSTVLYHYKFTHTFDEKVADALKQTQYVNNSSDYKQYNDVLQKNDSDLFGAVKLKKLTSINQLLKEKFVIVSSKYQDYLQTVREGAK